MKTRDDKVGEAEAREAATEPRVARRLTRRGLLQAGGTVLFASLAAACSDDDHHDSPGGTGGNGGTGGSGGNGSCVPKYDGTPGPETLFAHGIASGDPLPDAVMLWTRVSVDGGEDVDVAWEISLDAEFGSCTVSGSATASAARDFTVKVDATGLDAGTTYYYRFHALGRTSPVGRTRTAPSGNIARLRFAVVSCASLAHGFFHVYREISALADLDAVLHLGDYIYEYGSGQYGNVRDYEPAHEALTLEDYRTRHSQYKRDADLHELHRQHPIIAVWDDHETADNSYKDGASNHTEGVEGAWTDRKAAGQKAYSEWMPIRDQADPTKIWRELKYGSLVDLIMLDTRLWGRSTVCPVDNMNGCNSRVAGSAVPFDPQRTILGDDQAAWLEERLSASQASWRLIGQQVMMANLLFNADTLANPDDQWQGYQASRDRFLTFVKSTPIDNVVVLTGDIHSSWAMDLVTSPTDPSYDPATGKGSIAVEFVTPAVTSPGLPVGNDVVDAARPFNPHIRWFDTSRRGYIVLDVTKERVQSAWHLFDDITMPGSAESAFAAAWSVADGTTHLTEDTSAAAARSDAPPLAPA
jgi:alkaline phosphatase D